MDKRYVLKVYHGGWFAPFWGVSEVAHVYRPIDHEAPQIGTLVTIPLIGSELTSIKVRVDGHHQVSDDLLEVSMNYYTGVHHGRKHIGSVPKQILVMSGWEEVR